MGDPPIPARGEGQVEVKPAQDKVQPALEAKRERKKYKNLRRPAVWSLKWNQLCAQMLVRPKSSPGRRAIWVMRKLIVKVTKHHHIIIISVTIFITRTEGCVARSPREAMKDQARMSIVSFEARVGPVPTLSDGGVAKFLL